MEETDDTRGKNAVDNQQSLDLLQSCIDKVNNATLEEIELYKKIYDEVCSSSTDEESEFEFIFPAIEP